MFLKCHSRVKDGKEHRYWNIVENRRCGRGKFVQRQGRIPELGSLVLACRQDSSTVRTKRRAPESILMGKGDEERRQCLFTMNDEFLEESL
jgi:hypothetical protein